MIAWTRQLKLAAIVALIWFAMDIIEFADWLISKLNPPAAAIICLEQTPCFVAAGVR